MARMLLIVLVVFGMSCARFEKSSQTTAPSFEQIHKIDVHAHIFEYSPQLSAMLRSNNASIVNVCNRGRDGSLEQMHEIARDMFQREPDLYPFASSFDLTHIEDRNYKNQVIAWLDHVYRDGAVMTKIWKEVGMEVRRQDGTFVLPDDPIFDPIYEFLAARGKPLMAHIADPIDGWLPLDPKSPHYGYFSNHPEFHFYNKPAYPSHAALMAARDHILDKHPRLVVIGAHLGSLERDLDALGKRLDKYPNFYVDCAARTRDLTLQPRDKVRKFFIKYQDRILYGVDMTWKPFRQSRQPTDQQRSNFVANLEKRYRADYAFYAGLGKIQYDGREIEALALPPKILEKFYNQNARRIILQQRPH
jgi:predicted TIM-barrel fold metal-dependent hydrolase